MYFLLTQAFSDISRKTNLIGITPEITSRCNLENVILSDGLFTDNLDWIEKVSFESCYIQDGSYTEISYFF